MFAAAMAFSLGIKLDAIRQGLRTFDTTFFQAPGRMNVFNEHPFKVLFDYGHNAHAVGIMADLAQRLDVSGRRIVVLAGPGDRRDEDLRAIAKAVAGRFDHYVCRRDDNLRERASDEVPRIMAACCTPRACRRLPSRSSRTSRKRSTRAQDGPAGRPAAGLRRRADALVEADHQVPARGCAGRTAPRRGRAGRSAATPVEPAPFTSLEGLLRDERGIRVRAGSRRLNVSDLPFEDSRRLTGSNLFFDSAGAVLETLGVTVDDALLADWSSRIKRARSWLAWPDDPRAGKRMNPYAVSRARSIAIRQHATGTALALAAPVDQLFTATEVNEWAFCASLAAADPTRWSHLEGALIAAARKAAADADTPMSGAVCGLTTRTRRERRIRPLFRAVEARGGAKAAQSRRRRR